MNTKDNSRTVLMKPKILTGDCRDTLKTLPAESVHCCVTSPPYWGLRSYLPKGHQHKHLEIGSEPTPEAFVETMVQVFREVRRVLHSSGTVWLNLGDSYAANRNGGQPAPTNTGNRRGYIESDTQGVMSVPEGLKPKDLCLIPWRVALALQADGWWVRDRKSTCLKSSHRT